jgi:hypothetical protein
MLIKDVSKKIINGIKEPISELGFNLNKSKREFKRKKGDCEQIFQLLFYKEGGSILIRPVVRIKIKSIEDVYHKVSKKKAEYNDATTTLGNNLGEIIKYYETGRDNLSEYMNMRYLIEDKKDIEILKKVIPERFHDYALPYFDSNCSIKSVDQLLNTTPREMSIHNGLYPIRACIGLIAARLNNNPDFNEIVKIYEEELADANPDNKAEFEELKELFK